MSEPTHSEELKRALWLANLYALMFEIVALRESIEMRRETLSKMLPVIPVEMLRVQ